MIGCNSLRKALHIIRKVTIRNTPHKKQVANAGLLTCPEFSSQFRRLSLVDKGCSRVLDAGDICWSIKYMREAGDKSSQASVCRVVYGFVQALNAINVIPLSTGEERLAYLVRAYRGFSKV
jgi:hypothetical protein